ncbi:hypothetical protein ACWCQQ_48540, partial [Streptomyces sp. NPDC002143]
MSALDAAELKELLELGSATAYEASGLSCALPPVFRPAGPDTVGSPAGQQQVIEKKGDHGLSGEP